MNKVCLMGRFTKDLEVKKTASDRFYIKNTIAVNDKFDREKTDFINVIFWGKTAENLARFFQKGSLVIVWGRISTGSYEKEGKKVYTTDIVVDEFYFSGEKRNNDSQNNSSSQGFQDVGEYEELPF